MSSVVLCKILHFNISSFFVHVTIILLYASKSIIINLTFKVIRHTKMFQCRLKLAFMCALIPLLPLDVLYERS